MRAMVLHKAGAPLLLEERPLPEPQAHEVRVRVLACAVCRTDLHIVDGELREPRLPLVPGHEVVGVVEAMGGAVRGFTPGERVGIPWLGGACGTCAYCRAGRENLCDAPVFTGYTRDGGFANHALADSRFVVRLPAGRSDAESAPLLCAGLIGWRSFVKAGKVRTLGLYGFGAAAHLIAQVATARGVRVFAFTRPGDAAAQAHARALGCIWAGSSGDAPPEMLDAAILFAPDGALVPLALSQVRKGGTVVCGGIHMSDIPAFPYSLLWGERSVASVANLTRADGADFFAAIASIPLDVTTVLYPLERANDALDDLRAGRITGAAVLIP